MWIKVCLCKCQEQEGVTSRDCGRGWDGRNGEETEGQVRQVLVGLVRTWALTRTEVGAIGGGHNLMSACKGSPWLQRWEYSLGSKGEAPERGLETHSNSLRVQTGVMRNAQFWFYLEGKGNMSFWRIGCGASEKKNFSLCNRKNGLIIEMKWEKP